MTYNAAIWLKAEKHFKAVYEAQRVGNNIKIPIDNSMYLSSNLWGEYQKRYTGIHEFYENGYVHPNSGVNLDEREFDVLTNNFGLIKNALKGREVNFTKDMALLEPTRESIKMYVAEWVIDDDVLPCSLQSTPAYNKESAEWYADRNKPVEGKDYKAEDGVPEIRIRAVRHTPPEETVLMKMVLLEYMMRQVMLETKKNCEACQVESDSQFDHARSGNCLDDTENYIEMYGEKVKNEIRALDLVNVFNIVRNELGLKPILSMQLAKCALAWIPVEHIVCELLEPTYLDNPLTALVRKVVALS